MLKVNVTAPVLKGTVGGVLNIYAIKPSVVGGTSIVEKK